MPNRHWHHHWHIQGFPRTLSKKRDPLQLLGIAGDKLEAGIGIEPMLGVLQTPALPLG